MDTRAAPGAPAGTHWRLPLAFFAVLVIASSVAIVLDWTVVAVHHPRFSLDNDLIESIENAWWQGRRGGLTHLYSGNGSRLISLPGFQLLLVAAVRLGDFFHLQTPEVARSPHSPIGAPMHPVGDMWSLVVPIAFAAAFLALFPLDALCRRCGLVGWRRWGGLTVASAFALWVGVWWGHPEYVLAVGLLAWAALCLHDGRWERLGWVLGATLACQSIALLVVPLILVLAGRHWRTVALRSCVLPALVVALPLIGDPGDTLRAVALGQENPRVLNGHHTPWLAVVPHPNILTIDPGWPRTVAFALAIALAFPLATRVRRAQCDPASELRMLLWGMAVVISLRCAFESLVFPYYVGPPIVLVLLVAVGLPARRMVASVLGALALTWLVDTHLVGSWAYWLGLVGLLGLLLALSHPIPPGTSTTVEATATRQQSARRAGTAVVIASATR